MLTCWDYHRKATHLVRIFSDLISESKIQQNVSRVKAIKCFRRAKLVYESFSKFLFYHVTKRQRSHERAQRTPYASKQRSTQRLPQMWSKLLWKFERDIPANYILTHVAETTWLAKRTPELLFYDASTTLKRRDFVFPARHTVMADEGESSEAILNITAHPDVRTIFQLLNSSVKWRRWMKMFVWSEKT